MLVDPGDLQVLGGSGGELYERFVRGLVSAECRMHGIAPADVDWDYRTNCSDGGCDIYIRKGHSDINPRFIPNKPSIWSIKSGKDGIQYTKLSSELSDKAHQHLLQHLRDGHVYVWCALQPISQGGRQSMRDEANKLAQEFKFSPEQVVFIWVETQQEVIEYHPNLIARHLPQLVERLSGIETVRDAAVQDKRGFAVNWVEFSGRDALKKKVRQHLHGTEDPAVLHIAGLSGIGKTRTVVQACLDDQDLEDTLYVRQYAEMTEKCLRYLEASGRCVRVIIDEVSLTEYQSLTNRFDNLGDRIRIITIGPARRNERQRASDPSLILLEEPETEDGVLRVVQEAGQGLDRVVLESIAEASSHDLRLALLLVSATLRTSELRTVPIMGLQDVWERVTSLFAKVIGDPQDFARSYAVLTVAIDLGRAGKFRDEIEYLAKHFNKTDTDLDRAVAKADECGLGLKTPSFFEAIPRALAVWVFQDQLWSVLEPTVDAFLEKMPSERLRRRFIERCQELDGQDREEVLGHVGGFFLNHLGAPNVSRLIDRETSRVFQAWAELDPKRGLAWLKTAIDASSDDDLTSLDGTPDGSGGWRGRRQVVWLCEHLACFSDYFWDCEHILFRLAQIETEKSIGNNSTNTWRDMFRPILSNTEVPFGPRWDHLLNRLRKADAKTLELVLCAALGALDEHVSGIVPPTVVGGRVVPDEWRPATVEELNELRREAALRLLDRIATLSPQHRREPIMAVIGKLRRFVYLDLLSNLKEVVAQFKSDGPIMRSLRSALDDIISRVEMREEKREQDSSRREWIDALKAWRAELEPSELTEQIIDLTARDYWSVCRNAKYDQTVEEPSEIYQEMAKAVLAKPDVVKELRDWFSSENSKSGGSLALFLGQEDNDDVLRPLVLKWLQEGRAPEFVAQYLTGISLRLKGLPRDAMSALDNAVDAFPILVARTTVSSDISIVGYDRLMRCIDKLKSEERFVFMHLSFGGWADFLDTQQKCYLLDKLDQLAKAGDTQALKVAFDLLSGWSNHGKQCYDEQVGSKALDLLRSLQAIDLSVDDYKWKTIAEALVSRYPDQIAEVLADVISNVDPQQYQRSKYAQEMFKHLANSFPTEAMTAIGQWVLDEERCTVFRIRNFKGLFDAIGLDTVRPWVQQYGKIVAVRIARHLDGPQLDDQGDPVIPPLVDWLLTEFWDVQNVFKEFCMGRYSGVVRWGSARDSSDDIGRLTEPFVNHPKEWVRAWAQYERDRLQSEIERDDRMEDENNRT